MFLHHACMWVFVPRVSAPRAFVPVAFVPVAFVPVAFVPSASVLKVCVFHCLHHPDPSSHPPLLNGGLVNHSLVGCDPNASSLGLASEP